eukprot:gene21665-27706_t
MDLTVRVEMDILMILMLVVDMAVVECLVVMVETVDMVEDSKDSAVIGFFDTTTHQAELELFQQSIFVSVKHGERSKHRYPSKTVSSMEQLQDFVRQKALPVVGEMTPNKVTQYANARLPVLTVFTAVDHERNAKGFQYVTNRVRKVASEFKGRVLFNVANTLDFTQALDHYGFDDVHNNPILVGLVDENMYYAMDATTPFSVEALTAFVQSFRSGRLVGKERVPEKVPRGHSEESEDDGSPSSVVTLTDSNFKEVVTDSAADVLVEFYAPWCGHCKQLAPEFKRAASAFSEDSGVTLAAMDATAHTVPKTFDVQGYPTLYFVPADKTKKPQPYEGGRDEESIVAFLRAHRTTTL